MDKYQSMEEKLQNLMPASLSDAGQACLDAQIDQLAGVESSQQSSNHGAFVRLAFKSAAILVLMAIPFFIIQSKPAIVAVSEGASNLIVINSTNRMEKMTDDGLFHPGDGSVPYFRYRFEISNKEQFRDEDSGMIITVSQPSYQVVTIPQTVF